VPNQAPSASTSTAPSPPSVTKAAPTRSDELARDGEHGLGQRQIRVESDAGQLHELLVVGLDEVGRPRSTTARNAAPDVSTAMRGGRPGRANGGDHVDVEVLRKARRKRPGQHEPVGACRRAHGRVDERRRVRAVRVTPGRLILVVTPRGR
jgi:hypothetical protein